MENGSGKSLPILIVGAGPVGLFLALLLTRSQIPCQIIDANTSPDKDSTKAIAYQPAILQKAGILDAVKDVGIMLKDIAFRRTTTGEILVQVPTPPNAPGVLVLPQWKLMAVIETELNKLGVEVERGWNVIKIDNSRTDHVEISAENSAGGKKTLTSQYLVAADGGKSFVRKSLGIAFKGETLPFQLIATDVRYPFEKYGFSHTQFMMDPEHFGLISQLDNEGLWRVSFSAPNSVSTEDEVQKALTTKYDALFPGPRPLDFEVVNAAPYKSQQLCAETMRKGRVLLVGDAAHLTNPYAGLGLTSGLFDVISLAEVFHNITFNNAPDTLLTSWSEARIEKYHKVIDPMSRAAFYRVQDKDLDTICDRDPMFKAIKAGKMMPPPSLATEVEKLEGFVKA
ncbi:para-nitrophenol 4-monooxygenase [Venturia nashicola]|uniref:Para-nitrophenol 4-monooxygenase n=1 Tax=Venturia nashicola TaxID=86259 RepID=A0A4Z1PCW8_9PEZI|nr:para-nitrophenol 4-monooxygenase [Venturia nashicola]TLD37431.1 para-nitrophenol 4-monooxygenase [Venturia nashicola]